MNTIRILEKPNTISLDEVHQLLWDANEANRKNGFVLNSSKLSSEALKKKIGSRGLCLVALDGERLAGTISLHPVMRDRWYAKEEIAEFLLLGIHPDYQGRHLGTQLMQKAEEEARRWGVRAIELNTAENNSPAIHMYQRLGYTFVSYVHYNGRDHNSVVMVKWLRSPDYPAWYGRLRYSMKKYYVLLKNRQGR